MYRYLQYKLHTKYFKHDRDPSSETLKKGTVNTTEYTLHRRLFTPCMKTLARQFLPVLTLEKMGQKRRNYQNNSAQPETYLGRSQPESHKNVHDLDILCV